MASLAPELAGYMTSLLQLAASSNCGTRPFVGFVRFEFYFSLLMAIVMSALVGAWNLTVALAPAGGVVPFVSSVGMSGENAGLSWRKTTWHRIGSALVDTILFSPTLVMGLGAVPALGLALDGGKRRGTWLYHQD